MLTNTLLFISGFFNPFVVLLFYNTSRNQKQSVCAFNTQINGEHIWGNIGKLNTLNALWVCGNSLDAPSSFGKSSIGLRA